MLDGHAITAVPGARVTTLPWAKLVDVRPIYGPPDSTGTRRVVLWALTSEQNLTIRLPVDLPECAALVDLARRILELAPGERLAPPGEPTADEPAD